MCPAYAEDACPGDGNPGVRTAPNWTAECDLACGQCAGAGWSETVGYCGQRKQAAMSAAVFAEMGGSFRLDRYVPPGVAAPAGVDPAKVIRVLLHPPATDFPCRYFPVAEWYSKDG